jgi:hypothetical protein
VWREAPSTRLWEIAVRLLLGHRTDGDGGSEILLVLTFVPITSTSVQVGVFVPAGGPCLRFGIPGPPLFGYRWLRLVSSSAIASYSTPVRVYTSRCTRPGLTVREQSYRIVVPIDPEEVL